MAKRTPKNDAATVEEEREARVAEMMDRAQRLQKEAARLKAKAAMIKRAAKRR